MCTKNRAMVPRTTMTRNRDGATEAAPSHVLTTLPTWVTRKVYYEFYHISP